ncbi:MAG: hypothetical protein KAU94_11305 [Verrucomicrobia bacterium]|nr:hypothetical protein [Verrucomicrobiota bacterium]
MRNIISAALALLLMVAAGCGGRKPVPAGRLLQPAGGFSFVTPDNWSRTKLAGVDFIIASTDPDFGARPNIFVDFVQSPGQAGSVVEKIVETNRKNHRTYEVARQSPFATKSGLPGFRIAARRENKDTLPLALFHYVIQDVDRTIVITCTCAESVKQKYAPLFDSAMKSLESDRTGSPSHHARNSDNTGHILDSAELLHTRRTLFCRRFWFRVFFSGLLRNYFNR